MIAIVNFRGEKICHEHIYWDRTSALVHEGALNPESLPVAGKVIAEKVLDENLPANTLMPTRADSEGSEPGGQFRGHFLGVTVNYPGFSGQIN